MNDRITRAGLLTRGRPPGWRLPWRSLQTWVIVNNIRGDERIITENSSYDIKPNDCYLIPPAVRNQVSSVSGNSLYFCHCYVGTTASAPKQILLVPGEWQADCRKALPQIVALYDKAEPAAASYALNLARTLVTQALWLSLGRHEVPQNRIAIAEAWARSLSPEPVSVADMAAHVRMSRPKFSQLYGQQRGYGPGSFLRELRLQWAEQQLRETDASIATIARLVGYREAAAFNRAFARLYGMTPGRYRRAHIQIYSTPITE